MTSAPLVSSSLIEMEKLSRFNPLQDFKPDTLTRQIESFRAGRLRDLARTMEAMEEGDDDWKLAAMKAKSAVARNGWEVMIVEDAPEAEANRQKEALDYFYNNLRATSVMDQDETGGFRLLLRQMMDAHGKRYSVHNLVWEAADGFYKVTAHFCPLWFFENATGRMRFLDQYGKYDGIDMEPGAWLVTKGAGIGIACAVAWMYKHLPLRDWVTYSGLYGMPGIEGVTDAADGSDEWRKVEAIVAAAAGGMKYVRNRSCEVNKIEFGASGNLPYPPLVESMRRSIVSLWRGGDLSTISAGSGQGQGASLQGKESDIIDSDNCEWLSEICNHKLDRLVLDYVFGPGTPAYAYLRVTGPNKQDVDRDLKVDEFALKSGHPISREQFAERYNRPVPDGDDELLTAAAAPMQPPGDGVAEDMQPDGEDVQEASNELAEILRGPTMQMESRLRRWLAASNTFDPNQERADDGKWTSGPGGGGKAEAKSKGAYDPGVKVKPSKQRAFSGEPRETKTKLSKQEAGALGEKVVISWMQSQGLSDARPVNVQQNNFAVDLVQDHGAIEVKTGLVSNGKSAQQWRATIGQPGKEESKLLAKMSPEKKAAWNERKAQAIMERKQAAVAKISKELGRPVKSWTVTTIINPDTRTADIYKFSGFHHRITWNSDQAKQAYVGSVKY